MTRFHNTLFVTTQGAYIGSDHSTLEVRIDGETKMKVPVHHLSGIVCFGRISVSPAALMACGKEGVSVAMMSYNGRFIGRFESKTSGNVLLRRTQYRIADVFEQRLALARGFVLGKLLNYRAVINRAAREREDDEETLQLRNTASRLQEIIRRLPNIDNYDELLGAEGIGSADYFSCFDILLRSEEFKFEKRSRRPPKNDVNAMLSFGYAMLFNDCVSACEGVGLDPAVGFLHTDRPGRFSLALDLMEEFRPALVDRLVLALINRRQVQPSDFIKKETGAIEMSDATRKTFLVSYQEKKQESLKHPFINENTSWVMLPHIQARLLARVIRGDLEEYPPFVVR